MMTMMMIVMMIVIHRENTLSVAGQTKTETEGRSAYDTV